MQKAMNGMKSPGCSQEWEGRQGPIAWQDKKADLPPGSCWPLMWALGSVRFENVLNLEAEGSVKDLGLVSRCSLWVPVGI